MTTPSYPELVAAVRREGEAILASAPMDLDIPVPTCGDWRMRDLLLHIGRVYHRASTLVSERITTAMEFPEVPADAEPVAYMQAALDELVEALGSGDAETPAWNWSSQPQVAAFWARRMAHESAVHRYDAQRAHGLAQPIDADLAHDGMDELVDLLLPRIVERDALELPEATYQFVATDGGEWVVSCSDGKLERLAAARNADVSISGPTSAVLLAAYGRGKWASLETSGDENALTQWSQTFRF